VLAQCADPDDPGRPLGRASHSILTKKGSNMSQQETQTEPMYDVVVNHEEQYSIWPVEKELPLGWTKAGVQGTKQVCLDHIKEVWTDMRPLSLRQKMAAAQ
jgi:MbtH protein